VPLFPRTRDINAARIEEILSAASDRNRMMRLIIKDIEEALVETRSREAKLLLQARDLGREAALAEHQQAELTEQARQALAAGREDLARSALNEKFELDGEVADLRQRVIGFETKAGAIATEMTRLEAELAAVRTRQASIEGEDPEATDGCQ